jgi:hypothetical protein
MEVFSKRAAGGCEAAKDAGCLSPCSRFAQRFLQVGKHGSSPLPTDVFDKGVYTIRQSGDYGAKKWFPRRLALRLLIFETKRVFYFLKGGVL